MKLEVRNHEVRSSNELPGVPYIYCIVIIPLLSGGFCSRCKPNNKNVMIAKEASMMAYLLYEIM